MDVNKLSVDVQRLLSASAKVNNYRRAVEELVYNSLDAESTCIAIRIHIQKNWMQVVDNGIGIKKADYALLGQRYATSKLFDINTLKAVPSKYGYQGQALANIIEVSKEVKVTSRCADSNDTWVKMFVDGKLERECFKAPVRPSKGTTVEVNGFLYNLRIQKKNINTFDELQEIKTFLQQLSLVFSNVSISLRDDSENEIIFKMHKNRDIHQTLKSLFDINTNEYQELQVEKNDYKVKALIGVDKSRLISYNWIYLNNKFLSASNLHKVINNKFGKQNSMKQRKNKTKVTFKCNEENTILCYLVPFYFIFITCPYYEYDMVYSGKHATIEFKDWTQINNLTAKLIKFYNGDINLEKIKPKQVSSKPKNTEDEVRKIMEKFLGKSYKLRVSQMQNGIKGKKIKRKRNKQKTNISLTKIMPPKCARTDTQDKSLENINNVKLYKNKTNKQITNSIQLNTVERKSYGSNKQANLRHKGISKTKIIKKNRKISKPMKCKCNKKYDNLIEIFKNETHSTKKRCNELLWGLKDYFNSRGSEKNHDISLPHMQYKKSATNINFPDTLKAKNLSQKAEAKQIRSYDLLQTIISTQQGFHNQESRKKDCCVPVNKSTAEIQSYSKPYSYAPNCFASKLTFESHHYNIDHAVIEKEIRPKVQCISKQSIDNFDIGAEEQNRNIQVKTTNGKHLGLHFNSKTEKKHYIKKLNTLLDRCNDDGIETPFSIDLTGTNTVEICKQIRKQVINDMNSLFVNEDCDKIYSDDSPYSQFNYGINLNVERTYTILVNSFNNLSQADILLDNNHKRFIDETLTDTNVRNNDTINRNQTYKTSTDIFMSELSHTSQVNADEPLKVCEAILNSSKDTENFNNSFKEIPRHDSLFHMNADSNTSINKSKINGSPINSATIEPIKKNEEDSGNINVVFNVSNQIRYSTEKFCSYKIDTELDNSAYNFKLNNRHRFVPKGMSQMFKNCNSKNICSYNLDTEYYEHKIYNKFVENIAVNSEIYEPNVRNLKEFATEHIRKTTEKLNKKNADLIFETDSLRNAKVLGQVDCKFIAAIIQDVAETRKSPEFLVCFDQHAVDERIRLEKNLSYYVSDNNWKKTTIETISVKSSKDEILYLHNHKDKFSRFGLDWTIISDSEILVNAIPEAIRGKNPRAIDVIIKSVQDLISEQMHAIKYLKGNVSLYPKSIMNLVFSEACRSAIKFGDNLSTKDCIVLIAELADCKTPFQCAHGRPVMAVMVELNNDSVEYKINMDNLKQFQNRTKKLWN